MKLDYDYTDIITSFVPLGNYVISHPSELSHTWIRQRNTNRFYCPICKQKRIIDRNESFTLGYDCSYAKVLNDMYIAIGDKDDL